MQARADDAGAWTKGAGVAVKGHTTVAGRWRGDDEGQSVNGGVKTGHAAAQNQASGEAPSAMARALPK